MKLAHTKKHISETQRIRTILHLNQKPVILIGFVRGRIGNKDLMVVACVGKQRDAIAQ